MWLHGSGKGSSTGLHGSVDGSSLELHGSGDGSSRRLYGSPLPAILLFFAGVLFFFSRFSIVLFLSCCSHFLASLFSSFS